MRVNKQPLWLKGHFNIITCEYGLAHADGHELLSQERKREPLVCQHQ